MFKLKSNLIVFVLFIAASCSSCVATSYDTYISPGVQGLTNLARIRYEKYIDDVSYLKGYSFETHFINTKLADKGSVDTERHATDTEKKALFQRVMEAELIHYEHPNTNPNCYDESLINYNGTDPRQLLLKDHFTILKAVKEFSHIISQDYYNSRNHFKNTMNNSWGNYKQIERLSGINQETFASWFMEVFEFYIGDKYDEQKRDALYPNTTLNLHSNKKIDNRINENKVFSNVFRKLSSNQGLEVFGQPPNSSWSNNTCNVCDSYKYTAEVPFVGRSGDCLDYFGNTVLVNLTQFDDINQNTSTKDVCVKHIVIQDLKILGESQSGNPILLRTNRLKKDGQYLIDLHNSDGISCSSKEVPVYSSEFFFGESEEQQTKLLISGIPTSPLEYDEVYSFVSVVSKTDHIKTHEIFHLIVGNMAPIFSASLSTYTLGDFLESLKQYIILNPKFKQHLEKMIKFANGTL